MAALTTFFASRAAGLDITDSGAVWNTASAGGDTFAPSADSWLYVRSTNSGAVTVTVTPGLGGGPLGTQVKAQALAPTVGANTGHVVYGPFPAVPFSDVSDGQVHVSYSSASYVQVAVLNFGAT